MFGKIKKLARGSKGMEALQAVLLIGGGFVVVWGLMATWNAVQPNLQATVNQTTTGTPGAATAAPAQGTPGAPGAPAAPGTPAR